MNLLDIVQPFTEKEATQCPAIKWEEWNTIYLRWENGVGKSIYIGGVDYTGDQEVIDIVKVIIVPEHYPPDMSVRFKGARMAFGCLEVTVSIEDPRNNKWNPHVSKVFLSEVHLYENEDHPIGIVNG